MRLDKLKAQMTSRVSITWKSFLLRAEPKTGDRDAFLEYTKSWLRPAEVEPDVTFTVWASDEDQPSSSVPAHVAYKTVEAIAPELAKPFHDRLMRGYFTDNQNIADSNVLMALAADVGVDPDALAAAGVERRNEFTNAVIEEHNSAISNNVTGIPTVVFENQFPVPGAQPLEAYVRLVERIERRLD